MANRFVGSFVGPVILWMLLVGGPLLARDGLADINGPRMFRDLETLASVEMAGRKPGTEGHEKAVTFIVGRYREIGLEPLVDDGFIQAFEGSSQWGRRFNGRNIVGLVRGTVFPNSYIVLTAHYDHMGTKDGSVFRGADDNASGVACLLEMARYLTKHPPKHTVIFVALDLEEIGLVGSFFFVKQFPFPVERILLNINMDMISRNDEGPLYACGTYHYPQLKPLIEEANAARGFEVKMGFDKPVDDPRDDWTFLSDHLAFHLAGVPFLYFGVIDHEDYHKVSDTPDKIDKSFYFNAAGNILKTLLIFDREAKEASGASQDSNDSAKAKD